jgi:hypothetical protein
MSQRYRSVPLLFGLAAAVGLHPCQAIAQDFPATGPDQVRVEPGRPGGEKDGLPSAAAMSSLRSVSSRLDEAARQSDFSSRAEGLLRLQSARDRLENSINELCCARRARAMQLASNIDHVVERARIELGPLLSATGASLGSPAPNRDELVALAKEGEILLRDGPALPLGQRADELLAARDEGTWKAVPPATGVSPFAPRDPWPQFPMDRLDVKMYSFHF